MANENKETSKLVDHPDDCGISDIQSPEENGKRGRRAAPEIEIDAPTVDINELHPGTRGRTRSELEADLRERSRHIEELGFEIEHLRSHQRGLEAELEARKQIAANYSNDFETSRAEAIELAQTIDKRDRELRAMQFSLDGANRRIRRLRARTGRLQISARELQDKTKLLQARFGAQEMHFASLNSDQRNNLEFVKGAQPPQTNTYDRGNYDVRIDPQRPHAKLDGLRDHVDSGGSAWDRLNNELVEYRTRLEAERAEAGRFSREVEEREGQLATLDQENRILRYDNARIEQYADLLRLRLQDQVELSRLSAATENKLEARLDIANTTIEKLSSELDAEKLLNNDRNDTIEKLRREFENEIRQIRFELGAAEETIAGQEALNEQLVSNLIDHQGYRRALESQLDENEKENENTIRKLTEELKRARYENEDYDRKLSIKDNAISDLIQELSNHTSNVELRGEFDNVLQGIDGFKSNAEQNSSQANRSRVARLLIGHVDGRVLRFPLFKERLTIGRTSQNDITLNIQYVSRRHAVITTTGGDTRIVDWGSKNGVFVNRRRVSEQVLRQGDVVSIGMADFTYQERGKR